jgi:Fe-S cluster biosynthesis and repair protein YggX
MPRIPTFTSTAKPTTDVGGIKSGIQISPSSTIAAKLLPGANELTNYVIKKRDNEEKLIAKKAVLDLKAESDKIIQSQKDNISENEAINNWKTTFTPLINEKLSTVKNRRVKKLIESSIDLENSESIYHLKQNSFKAYEKESTKIYNDEMNIGVNNYKATDNPILKVKYKTDLKDKAEKFNKEHMLGANDLKKRKEAIDSVLLLTDADSFIGLPNAEKQIANLDSSLKGEKFLSNDNFNKSIYNSYEAKINSLAVEGDPNADYDEAIRLVNELENFERYNGNKVVSGTIEKSFAQLKEKVLGESIRHEDKVTKITQGNAFFDYSQGQKKIMETNFFNQFDSSLNKAANREKAFEAGQEYDQRIDAYLAANQDATYAEKQEYARDLRMNIIDKYEDIEIEKVTAFNLTSNKFNVTREADAVFELKKQYDIDPSKPNTLKTLAKLNGFVDEKGNPDVGALLNVYIPILQDREKN